MDEPTSPDAHRQMSPEEHWRVHELTRRARLREAGKRPLGVNLAQGLALSEFLSSFAGTLRKP